LATSVPAAFAALLTPGERSPRINCPKNVAWRLEAQASQALANFPSNAVDCQFPVSCGANAADRQLQLVLARAAHVAASRARGVVSRVLPPNEDVYVF